MDSFHTQPTRKAHDFDAMVQALQDNRPENRIAAMQSLVQLDSKQALPLLCRMLNDDDVAVRRTAARLLYRMMGDQAIELLDKETIRHLLRFRAPEEILSSATAVHLFLETLEVLALDSAALDIEHGEGTVVSGSPMEDYQALDLRTSGIEYDTKDAVRRVLSFFDSLKEESGGWWTIGPARGAGIIAFRKGDRFGETLYELAIARLAPDRYLTLATRCRYADWD